MPDRPNVLWLTYEDTSPQFVSTYGLSPVTTTPTIDRLTREGVRFDNAYATAPVCSASRTALITGCCNEATGLGHHRSKYPIPRNTIPGFPTYLQNAGYYTTNNVKTDYNIENEREFIDACWDESSTQAHWRGRGPGQPFFSVFNYVDSHQSRTMTRPWGWYEEKVLDQLPDDEIISPHDIEVPPFYRDTPEMRKHVSRVHNSLKLCDHRMKERLDQLRADGLMEDTIIFCFADHGEGIPRGKCNGIGFGYRASFTIWFPEKYEHLSPWGTQCVTDELVSFEDLAPTMLGLAGVPVPDYMTGRALMGEQRQDPPDYIFPARNRIDDTPDLCRSAVDGRFVYTRVFMPHLPEVKYQKYSDVSDIQSIIRRDYDDGKLNDVQARLVEPTRPKEYLYDLTADPWEIRNLADDPDYEDHLQRLRDATFTHIRDINDVMFLPESEMVDGAAPASPCERRSDTDYNPLNAMLAAADRVGDGAEGVEDQLEWLADERDGVRYWAAVGIYAARDCLTDEQVERISDHLQDPAPFVRAELAAAACAASRLPEAQRILESLVLHDDRLIAHQAVSRILYMPEVAPNFADSIEELRRRLREDDPSTLTFPADQAVDMYMHLYQDEDLYYECDVPYLTMDD